jgi:hypothetical protein
VAVGQGGDDSGALVVADRESGTVRVVEAGEYRLR